MRTEKSDPDRVYQNIPPAKQKQAGRFFDAATALACLLCAGATFYLFGFGMAAETFVFFITACAGLIGTHHFVSEPTIHRRRYAGTTATLSFVAMLLSGSSMLSSTPSAYRFAAVFMAYFFPIALACWLVLLARRLYGWLHDGEPFIFFGDLFSSSNETLTELGQSLSPKARSVINLVLAAFFTVWAIVETVDTLNYAAAEMQVSPEKTVTLQYASPCNTPSSALSETAASRRNRSKPPHSPSPPRRSGATPGRISIPTPSPGRGRPAQRAGATVLCSSMTSPAS